MNYEMVKTEGCTAPGTGTVNLGSGTVPAGYRAFPSSSGVFFYRIDEPSTGKWEIGYGSIDLGLSRDVVLAKSGLAVDAWVDASDRHNFTAPVDCSVVVSAMGLVCTRPVADKERPAVGAPMALAIGPGAVAGSGGVTLGRNAIALMGTASRADSVAFGEYANDSAIKAGAHVRASRASTMEWSFVGHKTLTNSGSAELTTSANVAPELPMWGVHIYECDISAVRESDGAVIAKRITGVVKWPGGTATKHGETVTTIYQDAGTTAGLSVELTSSGLAWRLRPTLAGVASEIWHAAARMRVLSQDMYGG